MLIDKEKTELGKIKYYFQTYENVPDHKHLVIEIREHRYDFRPEQIIRQSSKEESLFYELSFNENPSLQEDETFHVLEKVDSLVFKKAEIKLDSLKRDVF